MTKRIRLAKFLLRLAERLAPNVIREHIHTMAMTLASEMAQRAVMAYLDKERFIHCRYCIERKGLRRVGNFMVCVPHVAIAEREIQLVNEQELVAANGGK